MILKTVIVDDEYPAIQLIKSYCTKLNTISVEQTFTKAIEAFDYLQKNRVDLLLLDIQMPLMNGIEILKELKEKPNCIFITANPNYAVKAFELDVIDYLLKPISFERFDKAVEKAIEFYNYKKNMNATKKYLMVKADYKITKIHMDDIEWIEGSGEYIKIVTANKTLLVLDSLNNYIDNILPKDFLRIHKSFILPISKIANFSTTSIIHKNGNEFTIGRAYKDEVMLNLLK